MKSCEEIIARCQKLYEDLDFKAARAWKAEDPDRKVVGYMPIYVPREIMHAGGMLPLGIVGGGDQLEVIHGDAYYQSYICRIPRSTIELGVSGRLDFVDAMLIVVEPTRRSLGTAEQIKSLAADIGLTHMWLVGNKVRDEAEEEFIKSKTPSLPLLGFLPADLGVQEADRLGIPVYNHVPSLRQAAEAIAQVLVSNIATKQEAQTNVDKG